MPSNPVAITVIWIFPSSDSSSTAPKMMFASGSAACCTTWAASLISSMPRSMPPVMFISTPRAPAIDVSRSGLAIAAWAAAVARPSPLADPIPISAEPASAMIVRTSAKSRLMSPGTVIRSAIPCTPWRSTSSATRNASTTVAALSTTASSRSFGIVITVFTRCRRSRMPSSAAPERRRPSKLNGRVTTPIVSAPELACHLRDERRAARAGPAAHARGDEHHVGALEGLGQLLAVLLGGLPADLGIAAGAEPARQLAADVDLLVGVRQRERLRVRVDCDELDPAEAGADHPVHGVAAAAADPDHLDRRVAQEIPLRVRHPHAS